ncbi:MAG: protease modulator HflC [Deltaproteobacteria bacterium]|nr:MAG: protease modulator HflC [Deltaproteobacteria bacterium]
MKISFSVLITIIVIAIILGMNSFFTVDETEQVIITQFGKPVGEPITEPGLKFKIPFIQTVNYFPKNLLEWDGDPGQIPTLDKTYIWVDTFARWRIVDPLKFFRTVNNEMGAQRKLDDILDPAVRNFITSYHLIEVVRNSNRPMDTMEVGLEQIGKKAPIAEVKTGREKITRMILAQARPKVEAFGIEIVDIRIKRINYVEEVRKAVYERMIQERKQIAEKFRSEGMGESKKIEGEKEKELKRISSEAYRKAQEIKGKADAEAVRICAEAFSQDPEFYSFVKTLDVYKTTFDENTWLMLSTDSDFFKYLKGYSNVQN